MIDENHTYKTLLESTKAIPWKIDWETKLFTYIGPQIEELLGWSQDSWVSAQDWIDRIHQDERDATASYSISQSMEGIDHEADYRALKADGGYVWIRDVVHVLRKDGKTTGLIGFMFDISERKKSEERLTLASKVFLHTHDGILITDISAKIIETNKAFTKITGYSRDEVLGKNPRLLKSGHQEASFYRSMWQTILRDGFWSGEVSNRTKTGELYIQRISISAVKDTFGNTINYVALFADITQLKDYQQQLEYMAYHDALTGLPNRILLVDRLQQQIIESKNANKVLVIAYIDLDGFKTVNDEYGHKIGDNYLITITKKMNELMQKGDTLSRIGGDEFVALLSNFDKGEECRALLNSLLESVSTSIRGENGTLELSASIGVVVFPQILEKPDVLLQFADIAMYEAKKSGKSCYRYFDYSMLD